MVFGTLAACGVSFYLGLGNPTGSVVQLRQQAPNPAPRTVRISTSPVPKAKPARKIVPASSRTFRPQRPTKFNLNQFRQQWYFAEKTSDCPSSRNRNVQNKAYTVRVESFENDKQLNYHYRVGHKDKLIIDCRIEFDKSRTSKPVGRCKPIAGNASIEPPQFDKASSSISINLKHTQNGQPVTRFIILRRCF